jgi:hypothetical protein
MGSAGLGTAIINGKMKNRQCLSEFSELAILSMVRIFFGYTGQSLGSWGCLPGDHRSQWIVLSEV